MSGETLTGVLKSLGILEIRATTLAFESQRSFHRVPKKSLALLDDLGVSLTAGYERIEN